MKSWKKLMAIGAACSSLFFAHAEAAYQLNEEVTNPPAALQMATQIGTLSYKNPNLQNQADKDAIVVLSFGTTFKDQRTKAIDATAQAIQAAHPNAKVVTAFTSHIVLKHIMENEGKCDYLTPEQTLEQLKNEGYTRIALVSLSIVPGMEYKYNVALFHEFKTQFKAMSLSTPLMYWQGQEEQPDDVMQVMQSLHLPAYKKGTAILLMAHGTPDPSNAYYSVMQAKLKAMKRNDVLIYTVEGYPRLDDWSDKLKTDKVEKIILIPFMLVAGDHANNDMAGNEDDSHKVILEKLGFKVEAKLQGLGENKNIRDIFVERANEAWVALVR